MFALDPIVRIFAEDLLLQLHQEPGNTISIALHDSGTISTVPQQTTNRMLHKQAGPQDDMLLCAKDGDRGARRQVLEPEECDTAFPIAHCASSGQLGLMCPAVHGAVGGKGKKTNIRHDAFLICLDGCCDGVHDGNSLPPGATCRCQCTAHCGCHLSAPGQIVKRRHALHDAVNEHERAKRPCTPVPVVRR